VERGGIALLKDAPRNEDWAAVGRAIRERMRELGISSTHLAQETGLSPTTIRHIGESANRRTKSTLVAISAVLDWRYDHLTNILHGEPQKNSSATSPLEPHFESLLRAEVGPVKEEVAGIRDIIHVIDKKIDVIIESQHSATGAAGQFQGPGQPPERL
jgi:plasmid maintenance system antidote protein VapI